MISNQGRTSVRPVYSRSWFSPVGARSKAAALRSDLVRVVQPGKAVFLTLTYRRGEETPADLWARASAERHVRRFIDALEAELGRKLTGEWVRKAEFQQGGYVHWHLIIRGVRYLKHSTVAAAWPHGYVWVSACTRRRLAYFAKYFAKDGKVPAFLLAARSRSVKVVAASPGFWLSARGHGSDGPRRPRQALFRPIIMVLERIGVAVTLQERTRGYGVSIAALASVPASSTRSLLDTIYECSSWDAIERIMARARGACAAALHLTNHPIPPNLTSRWLGYMEEVGAVAA